MSYNDTSPEAEAILKDLLRHAPVWRKLKALGQLNLMAKTLALSDLREKHPHVTDEKLRRLLAGRLLGKELATTVYGPYAQAEPNEERVDAV